MPGWAREIAALAMLAAGLTLTNQVLGENRSVEQTLCGELLA
jgi:hypothetical protein